MVRKKEELLYVQLAVFLTDDATIEREFGNLEKIRDNFPKVVLSLDEYPVGNRNGIRWYHLRDWLQMEW